MRRARPPRLSADARSARVRPPDRATVPRRPPRGAPKRPAPGSQLDRAQSRAARGDRQLQAAAAVGPLGQGGEPAVGRRHLELGLDGRAAAHRLDAHADDVPAGRVHRRRRQELVAAALVAAGGGAVERPCHRGDAGAVGPVRIADREGDEQAVARDQAAVRVADANAEPGRHLHRQLDRGPRREDGRRTWRSTPAPRSRRRAARPGRWARAARRAGRQAGDGPSRSLERTAAVRVTRAACAQRPRGRRRRPAARRASARPARRPRPRRAPATVARSARRRAGPARAARAG